MNKLRSARACLVDPNRSAGSNARGDALRPEEPHRECNAGCGLSIARGTGAEPGDCSCAGDLRDVRMDRIVRLRAAIASGRYGVSAIDLAEKLVERGLFGSDPADQN